MLLGNVDLTEKIQPEIIKFLKNKGTEELITGVLKTEWDKMLDWQAEKLEKQFEKQEIISMLKTYVNKMVRLEKGMNTPLLQLTSSIQEPVLNIVPKVTEKLCEWSSTKVETIMEKLKLADMVGNMLNDFLSSGLNKCCFQLLAAN